MTEDIKLKIIEGLEKKAKQIQQEANKLKSMETKEIKLNEVIEKILQMEQQQGDFLNEMKNLILSKQIQRVISKEQEEEVLPFTYTETTKLNSDKKYILYKDKSKKRNDRIGFLLIPKRWRKDKVKKALELGKAKLGYKYYERVKKIPKTEYARIQSKQLKIWRVS